jgi:hypothetical protein
MRRSRAGSVVVVAVVVALAAPSAASAGGAPQLSSRRQFHRPGEVVELREDNVTKGPYRAFLRWAAYQPAGVGPVSLPPPQVEVGQVQVERSSEMYVRATLSFTVPALPDGMYEVLVCSPGCRDPLGDLYPGSFHIGTGPAAYEAEKPPSARAVTPPPTVAPPTSVPAPVPSPQAALDHVAGPGPGPGPAPVTGAIVARDPPTAAGTDRWSPVPIVILGAALAAGAAAGTLVRRRRRPAAPA